MQKVVLYVIAVAGLAVLAAIVVASAANAASCHVTGTDALIAPDNACTPGAYTHLTRPQVCTTKDRHSLPAAERRRLLNAYGVPGWTGANGEIDHRVPFFLGGLTVRANLWPEPGNIPNAKDFLEGAVYRRVCFGTPHRMRVRTAVRLFLADWRDAYSPVVLGRGRLHIPEGKMS